MDEAMMANLARLLSIVPRDWDVGELATDEHKRHRLYVDALASMVPGSESSVMEVVRSDPDRAMSQAAIVDYLDRTARRLSTASEYVNWLNGNRSWFEGLAFAQRRAEEWHLLKELSEDKPVDLAELNKASDWLQRKVAEEVGSEAVLETLKRTGRTKRVRAAAATRLAQLSRSRAARQQR